MGGPLEGRAGRSERARPWARPPPRWPPGAPGSSAPAAALAACHGRAAGAAGSRRQGVRPAAAPGHLAAGRRRPGRSAALGLGPASPRPDARLLRTARGDCHGRQDPGRGAETGRHASSMEETKQSKSQQLKKVFQEYGAVGVSLHIGISLVSLGIVYMAISSGIDMSAILLKLGFTESLVQSKMAAGTSTFVVAYAIHKLFAPIRISITLVSVPFLVRYFRRVGLLKPPASKP